MNAKYCDFFNSQNNDFKVPEKHTEEIWKEDDFIHGTYNLEQRLLSYVRNGDVEGLAAFFKTVANTPTPEGKLADDALRQSKNIFIGFIALVGKVGAIKGNLDIEQTYQLIDLYTQECERCISVNQVNELRYNAIIGFCTKSCRPKASRSIFQRSIFRATIYKNSYQPTHRRCRRFEARL